MTKVIHKVKDTQKDRDEFLLINRNGSWNILCNTQSSHIKGSEDWIPVTCKRCLKLRKLEDKN